MAPLSSALALSFSQQPTSLPAKAFATVKEPVDADIRVCLDFIKGRCARKRCRFHHPEMSTYQQLSGALQVQAGKQICEVWAMAGQCKFGAKCNKLHPIVVNQLAPAAQLVQPAQLAMAPPLPLAAMPQHMATSATTTPLTSPQFNICAPPIAHQLPALVPTTPLNFQAAPSTPPSPLVAVLPSGLCSPVAQQKGPRTTPFPVLQHTPAAPIPLQPKLPPAPTAPSALCSNLATSFTSTACIAAAPTPVPLRPQHVVPPQCPSPKLSDPEAELQDLATSILKVLETDKWDHPRIDLAPCKRLAPAVASPQGRSLATLFDMDRIFVDIINDVDCAAC
eukprot:GGOE01010183.1.p2 GENE.GGOE01010183.1~~GGOE01010183.1.p2  ORF type:complete len:336 (-),score=76.84 GGOE01010183.1:395-1402(-)